jgi:hypothetical protein
MQDEISKLATLFISVYEAGLKHGSGYKVGLAEIKNQSFTKVNYYHGMAEKFLKDHYEKRKQTKD